MLIFVQYSIDKSVAIFTIFANCTSEIKLYAGTYNSLFFLFYTVAFKIHHQRIKEKLTLFLSSTESTATHNSAKMEILPQRVKISHFNVNFHFRSYIPSKEFWQRNACHNRVPG